MTRTRYLWPLCLLIALFVVAGGVCFELSETFRTTVRWPLVGWRYKNVVLEAPKWDGLQHVEWDGWGMGGAETVEYLVYEPADSLRSSQNKLPGALAGTAKDCEVRMIWRLEARWYVVGFFTNEDWGACAPN